MIRTPVVDYRFMLEPEAETWVSIDSLLDASEELFDHWLSLPELSCCTMPGGFFIYANGVLWNQDAVDEIRMSVTWLGAIHQLLMGRDSAQVWAWEESHMTLERKGETVEMEDIHHSDLVVCARVAFNLLAFTEAMLVPARKFTRLADAIRGHIAARRAAEGEQISADLADRFETIEQNLPSDWGAWVEKIEGLLPPLRPQEC